MESLKKIKNKFLNSPIFIPFLYGIIIAHKFTGIKYLC